MDIYYDSGGTDTNNRININNRCNCSAGELCNLKDNRCQESNIVHKAIVKAQKDGFYYVGATANKLKTRINNYIYTFRNPSLKNATSLSKLIWRLKNEGRDFTVQWEIIANTTSYAIGDSSCKLCILELYLILKFKLHLLNERLAITWRNYPLKTMKIISSKCIP